ncbi:hypothetical protein F2Q68_00034588 [Brassica cretica]|uniref:Uncharacterized protein n=1 Tax=Brassica cretica TaxID=69181 RepID=A0A8S9H106_BRACR|nr:hypothetical protein F2Q68_00034588 [Brassica cretica]
MNLVAKLGYGACPAVPEATRKNICYSQKVLLIWNACTICKGQRSTSLDVAAFTSTDSRTHPSTDTRISSSTDIHRSTSIDPTPRTLIDPQSRNMVATVILRQDENGDLYDQDGHLRNATGWASSHVLGPCGPSSDSKRLLWLLSIKNELSPVFTTRTHGLMSYRAKARSLRSDRAEHVFGCCVATLFELLSDDLCFFRKAFRKEESISKKYLSKKVSTFSSSGILTLTSLQPFSTPTVSPPSR